MIQISGIKNGKLYGSKAAAYQVLVRPERKVWNYDGSVLLDTIKPLTAEFATHLGEFTFHNPMTGGQDTGADIRGHRFHSAQQAEEKGWTQEEHDEVVKVLDRLCVQDPEHIWEIERVKATAPWPAYDDQHHKQIVPTAQATGLVAEALAYENENKARPEIVNALTALLEQTDEAPEELTAE